MKVVVQRVSKAAVTISNTIKGKIDRGLVILVGIERADNINDINWLCNKIINLRIFNDAADLMNLSVKDIKGEILLISQFTLHASTKKGNRPSYIKAAKPKLAIPTYELFITHLEKELGKKIQTGEFGADMKVDLINDGPVTIIMDSKNKD